MLETEELLCLVSGEASSVSLNAVAARWVTRSRHTHSAKKLTVWTQKASVVNTFSLPFLSLPYLCFLLQGSVAGAQRGKQRKRILSVGELVVSLPPHLPMKMLLGRPFSTDSHKLIILPHFCDFTDTNFHLNKTFTNEIPKHPTGIIVQLSNKHENTFLSTSQRTSQCFLTSFLPSVGVKLTLIELIIAV